MATITYPQRVETVTKPKTVQVTGLKALEAFIHMGMTMLFISHDHVGGGNTEVFFPLAVVLHDPSGLKAPGSCYGLTRSAEVQSLGCTIKTTTVEETK